MSYWGDFPLGQTINKIFTTRAFATGIPTVLAGVPVLSVYEDANLVQITAGVTVTVDNDAVVGLNRANIVATSGNGYESGKSYGVVLTTGTVGGVSVVGEVVGNFNINRSAAFAVTGALTAAAAAGDPSTTESVMQYVKQLVNILIGTAGVVAFPAEAAPANAVSLAEVIRAIHADVTGLAGATMRGTDNAALASVLGALANAAAAGDPTATDTLMAYVKQLINILIGTAGIVTFPAEAAPANAVSLAEVIRAVAADVTGLAGAAMRGTDAAALASVATAARLAELDPANLPADNARIETDTQDIQSRLPAALVGARMDSNVSAVNNNNAAAVRLALATGTMVVGTVDTAGFAPTTTEFEADDITEATASHFNDRSIIWTTGALTEQQTEITAYTLTGGRGHFTVAAMTEAPANNDTFIIV